MDIGPIYDLLKKWKLGRISPIYSLYANLSLNLRASLSPQSQVEVQKAKITEAFNSVLSYI